MNEAARFWAKVDRRGPDECWIWRAAKNHRGYGLFLFEGRLQPAHRAAYFLTVSRDVGSLFVCHSCDNRACVNPAHLWIGTPADNTADMMRKGRHRTAAERPFINPRAKLSVQQVLAIRRDWRPLRAIAQDYGVHAVTIHGIRSRKTWTHIADEIAA